MPETLKDLYGKLEKANIRLPDYDTFEKKYSVEGGAEELYNKLDAGNVKLPEINEFKSKYFTTTPAKTEEPKTWTETITKSLTSLVSALPGGAQELQFLSSAYEPIKNYFFGDTSEKTKKLLNAAKSPEAPKQFTEAEKQQAKQGIISDLSTINKFVAPPNYQAAGVTIDPATNTMQEFLSPLPIKDIQTEVEKTAKKLQDLQTLSNETKSITETEFDSEYGPEETRRIVEKNLEKLKSLNSQMKALNSYKSLLENQISEKTKKKNIQNENGKSVLPEDKEMTTENLPEVNNNLQIKKDYYNKLSTQTPDQVFDDFFNSGNQVIHADNSTKREALDINKKNGGYNSNRFIPGLGIPFSSHFDDSKYEEQQLAFHAAANEKYSVAEDMRKYSSQLEGVNKIINDYNKNINLAKSQGKDINFTDSEKEQYANIIQLKKNLTDLLVSTKKWGDKIDNVIDTKLPDFKKYSDNQAYMEDFLKATGIEGTVKYSTVYTIGNLLKNVYTGSEAILESTIGQEEGKLYDERFATALFKPEYEIVPNVTHKDRTTGEISEVPITNLTAIQFYDKDGKWHPDFDVNGLAFQTTKTGIESTIMMLGAELAPEALFTNAFAETFARLGVEEAIGTKLSEFATEELTANEIAGGLGKPYLWSESEASLKSLINQGERLAKSSAIKSSVASTLAKAGDWGVYTTVGFVAPSIMFYDGDMIKTELDRGLSLNQATLVGSLRAGVEGLTEQMFVDNFLALKWLLGKGEIKTLEQLGENEIYRSSVTEFIDRSAKSAKYNRFFKDLMFQYDKNKFKEGSREFVKILVGESIEEILGNLLNVPVNSVAKKYNKNYKNNDDFSLENNANTVIQTMATMLPQALLGFGHGYSGHTKNQRTAQFYVGESPEVYKKTIYNLLNNGNITSEEAVRRIQLIDHYAQVHENLKPKYDIVDQEEKDDIQKGLIKFSEKGEKITPEARTQIENEAKQAAQNKKYELFNENINESLINKELTKPLTEEKRAKLLTQLDEIAIKNSEILSETKSPGNIKRVESIISNLTSPENINSPKNSEQIQTYINQLNLLRTRGILHGISEKSIEDIDQAMKTLQLNKNELIGKETTAKTPEIETTITEEEPVEETGFKLDDEKEKIKKLTLDELDGYVIPTEATADERKELAKIKNEREIELETPSEKSSEEEFETETFDEPELETKKADIEKRRQEKLTKAEESAKLKINEWQKKADEDIKRNGVISKPVSNALNAFKGSLFNELERINEAFDKELLDNNIPNAKELIEKRKKIASIENSRKNNLLYPGSETSEEINAKYDKELSELEQPTEKTNTKEVPNEEKSTEIVEETEKEAKPEEEEITPPAATEEEIKAQEELDAIAKEADEEEKKKADQAAEKAKKVANYNPLSTVTPFANNAEKGIIQKVAINSIKWIKNQMFAAGKSMSDLGYYLTIHDVKDFPSDKFSSDFIEYWNKNNIKEEEREGVIAVITDKEGNIIYFDETGKPVKEGGYWSTHTVRSNFNTPTTAMSKAEMTQWEINVEKAKAIRQAVKPGNPVTYSANLTSALPETKRGIISVNYQGVNYKISVGKDSWVVLSDGNGESRRIWNRTRSIRDVPNLAESIYDFLNMNNTDGLPEAFIPANDTFAAITQAFKNRMSQGETNVDLKTFPEIFFYTRNNYRIYIDAETKTPYITNDKKEIIAKTRQEFLDFVNSQQINLSKRAENDVPLEIYRFKDGKFSVETISYKDFVANNFEADFKSITGVPEMSFNESVKKEEKEPNVENEILETPEVKPEPVVETGDKLTFDFSDIEEDEDSIDDVTDTKGLDRVSSLEQKTSLEQEKEAEQWFNEYLKKSGVSFTDSRNIANSTAFASWKNGVITLWKSGKFTDLYHEAFHDFSQLFLTKEQKTALYNEARQSEAGKKALQDFAKKLNKDVKSLTLVEQNFALEEMLAEDFYNYMLSGQKLILNQRVKRNTIFRKMYNFLKELFTGKPNIETIYKNLASKNINKAQRDPVKAMFGTLNRSIPGLSISDSSSVYSAIDSLASQQLNNRGISISKVFLERGYLDKVYGTLKNTLLSSAKQLALQYEKDPTPELAYTLYNLKYTLQNWENIKNFHRQNSKYLKVSKELIPNVEITDGGEEVESNDKYGDARENINPKDDVSQYILYLVASLPKYAFKNGKPVAVFNNFLPNIQETVDFGVAWGQLAKTLEGDKDYESMYKKIDTLSKKNPSYVPLLTALPDPSKQLTRYELQLKASFINALSKPIINYKSTSFEYSAGRVNIQSRNAEPITFAQLKQDWNLAIQEISNPYREKDESGQYVVNLEKLIKDFKGLTKSDSLNFLNALGFTFSQATLDSPEMTSILNQENKTLKNIYNKIVEYKDLMDKKYPNNLIPSPVQMARLSKPFTSTLDALSTSIYVDGKPLFTGLKEVFDNFIELELRNSEKYHSDSVTNAEGNSQWLHKNWSLQSQDYSLLNDISKFPTYQHLISDPNGAYFDISLNPDANNIFVNALFILDVPKSDPSYGKRRVGKGKKEITLELFDQGGIRISNDKGNRSEREGIKTSKLSRFMALIVDIPSLLTTGEKQHLRYGDKSTSRGTLVTYPSLVKNVVKSDKHIPVDINNFQNPDILSEQAWLIFRNSIISTLQITNDQTANNTYSNAANIVKNIKASPFGKFDKIFSKETKEALSEAHSEKPIDVKALIDKNKAEISKDLLEYFKKDSQKILDEIDENPIVKENDIFPERLLNNYSKEQMIRAMSMNSWIINSEHERLIFQDQRFYDVKQGSPKENYREPFKRYSKASSTGIIPLNDTQINNFFNNPESNSFAEKANYDKNNPDSPSKPYVEEGIVNSVIVKDVKITPTDYLDALLEHLKNSPNVEIDAVKEALKDIKITDAMGVCTFDFYRNLKLRIGEESWSDESEKLYQKIARGEELSKEDETNAYLFFAPLKFRVAGRTYDENKKIFIPIDYKFAITPLLGTTVKGKVYESIKDNMLRQNVHLMLFSSGSKHSAITSDGEYNSFYDKDGKPYTGDYTINPVPVEYFYEVVNSPDHYKEESRFSTQFRTLLFSNIFNNGKPIDYTKNNWDSLSEDEKKKQSPFYRRAVEFRDAIDNIVSIRKENLLKQLKAVYNSESDSYTIDQSALSSILEKEFENKDLPFNIIKSIQNENGKFKFKFDATIARDEIENTILSIIDNRLRKQNVYGEALIQVSATGFETSVDDTLPFYQDKGRTLANGDKVTSAHKVKISLQGDFKKLLEHPDVISLSKTEDIINKAKNLTQDPRLTALNTLISDESWLDKGKNREMITFTGVRIPVQGLNSMEFMEVHEFFPTQAGSIIAVSPALVAKSGGDFDWDKITSNFPHIYIDKKGNVKPIGNLSDKEIKELYTEEDGSKDAFYNSFKEKYAQNKAISVAREVLEDPKNFSSLVLPNATYMFEDVADERKAALQKEKPGYSDNYTVTESLNQHESNFVGKDALGIGAIANKFFPMMQQVGLYLNKTYVSSGGKERNVRNRFDHNKNSNGNISVSGIYSVEKPGKGKYKISESFSQLMNGWVDVAKKDWIFYINGRKEFAPVMLFHLMQGTHKDDVVSFFNQPILYEYIKTLNNYKNPLVKAINREAYKDAKKKAIYEVLNKYIPDNLEMTVYFKNKPNKINVKQSLNEKYDETPFFYGFLNNQMRELADENEELFDSTKFDYDRFSIPKDGKIEIPKTDKEKLAQALYLIQYLELEEQTKLFSQMRRTLNNDTTKASSFQYSKSRKAERNNTEMHNLFPIDLVKKMANESTIAAFTNDSKGMDTFIQQLSTKLFDVTNHPKFNSFIFSEWSKPESANFISFDDKNQDNFDLWLRTFKNDFVLFLYDNNVFDESNNLVATKVYQQMQYKTALAHDMEQLKRDFPNLTENNLFLQYLVKDNSLRLNTADRPEKVNIKLKFDKLDKDNSDIMSEDFKKLLEFNDPSYTPDQQARIKNFAENLAYFSFVQSGLNKTPFYLAKFIPQEYFAGKMQEIIDKTKEIFDKDPDRTQKILTRFNARFRYNNPKFYTQQYDDYDNPKITFNQNEPYRYKNYVDAELDLFDNVKLQEIEKLKNKTSVVSEFKANEATENPNVLYVFGDSQNRAITQNSAKISLVKKGSGFARENQENVVGIPVMISKEVSLKDEDFLQNQSDAEQYIKMVEQLSKKYDKIVFPDNMFEGSNLKENAPITYNWLATSLNEKFGLSLPVTEQSISDNINSPEEEDTEEAKGCDVPF